MGHCHVNIGHLLAKPYESDYALWRRCLTVNPGISLAEIQRCLRISMPQIKYFSDRLERLQFKAERLQGKLELEGETYLRQCPQCAQHLYHSDIYALPWLSHCPIHHCKLTMICPVCHEPWPDLKSLSNRECHGCGRVPFDRLPDCLESMDYRPIGEIAEFLVREEPRYTLGEGHGYMRQRFDQNIRWWRHGTIAEPLFPASQVQCKPEYTTEKRKALHIHYSKVQFITSPLIPADKAIVELPYRRVPRREILCRDIEKTSQRKLTGDFKTFQFITRWLRHNLPGHQCQIANYRWLNMRHFSTGPAPCPYCLALSLWFSRTATKRYGHHYTSNIDDFTFLKDSRFPEFFEVAEPYVQMDEGLFFLDDKFTAWFYRRGLEMLFMYILHYMLDWYTRLGFYQKSLDMKNIIPDKFYRIEPFNTIGAHIQTYLKGDKFYIYYEYEHPLNHFPISKIPRLAQQCKKYHLYHRKSQPELIDFTFTVPEKTFNFRDFMRLHQKFNILLNAEHHY